jgi:DNA-binding NarL/FixJ family response regulator
VLLADDHPMFREGLRFTLTQSPDVTVVAEAGDGAEALRLVDELDPDLLVMDLNMPGVGGLEALRRMSARGDRVRVLVLTMYEDDATVFAAVRAGAGGYLAKGAHPDQVLSAVRAVAAGHAVFGPSLAARVLGFFDASREHGSVAGLSAREQEVLTYLAEGMTNAEIAGAMFISPITVRNHLSSIFAKLQVTNRGQAVARARSASAPTTPSQVGQQPDRGGGDAL